MFRGAAAPAGGYDEWFGSFEPRPTAPAIGALCKVAGSVTITRANSINPEPVLGDHVYEGDVIETGVDGFIAIAFSDGTTLQFYGDSHVVLDEFVFAADNPAASALFRIVKGAFGLVAGKVAAAGRLIIDTPYAQVRGRTSSAAIGSVAFGILTIALIDDLRAASADLTFLDNGLIDYKDLKHGVYVIHLKKPIHNPDGTETTDIVVDDPGVTIILQAHGSSVGITQIANSPFQMGVLQNAYQAAFSTFSEYLQDPFFQQWQHANANPQSNPNAGSSTSLALLMPGSGLFGNGGNNPFYGGTGSSSGSTGSSTGSTPTGSTTGPTVYLTPANWSAGSGNWNNQQNWAGFLVPGATQSVILGNGSTVTIQGGDFSVSSLEIENGSTLVIAGNGSLTLTGENSLLGTSPLPLQMFGGTTITGGTLIIDSGLTFDVEDGPPAILKGVTVINTGAIIQVGTTTTTTLLLDFGTKIINGTLAIGSDGVLDIEAATGATLNGVKVTDDGAIDIATTKPAAAARLLLVNGTEVKGGGTGTLTIGQKGTLDIVHGSTTVAGADATLNGVVLTDNGTITIGSATKQATLLVDNGTTITVEATGEIAVAAKGTFDVEIGAITDLNASNGIAIDGTFLVDISTLTLQGGGGITLTGIITGAAAADQLINQDNIVGFGTISNLALTNSGIIDATGTIVLDTGTTIDNAGLIEATGASGVLDIQDSEIDWTGTTATPGTNGIVIGAGSELLVDVGTLTLGGGDVELAGTGSLITGAAAHAADALINDSDISGAGKISNLTLTNNGTIDATGTITLDTGQTITNAGLLEATGGGELDVKDGMIDNTGTGALGILVDGTSELLVDNADLRLTGDGAVTLDAGSNIVGNGTLASPDTLENVNNTIAGAGTIGDGTGDLALKNDADGIIDATGTITLDTGQTITNAGLLEATGGGELDVKDATIDNTGTGALGILVDGTSELLVDNADLQLKGDGLVTLDAGSNIVGNGTLASPDTLENVNNTIAGAGTIGDSTGDLALNNDAAGTIDATGTIVLDTGQTVTNAGLLEATGGGELDVKDATIDNTGTGALGILVDGTSELLVDNTNLQLTGDGLVTLDAGSNIVGNGTLASPNTLENVNNTIAGAGTIGDGTGDLALNNDAAGTIDATGTIVLDTGQIVTNAGLLEATGGGELDVKDATIDNTGTGALGILVDGTSELLVDNSNLQLTGDGLVTLDDGSNIVGNGTLASPDTLENVGNTITGAGTIGDGTGDLALNNDAAGTIDATGTIVLDTGQIVTNAGLLEATGGGELDVKDALDNTNTGTVTAGDATQNTADTVILAGRVTNAGLIEAIDDGTLEIQAAVIVNTATASDEGIVIQAGSELLVDTATLKLFGHGAVTLDAGSKVEGGAAGDTLINANNTITGAGTIGDGSGDLALINRTHGTIDATGTLTFATGSTVTNRGLLEATGGGELDIKDSTIANTATASGKGILVDSTSKLLVDTSDVQLTGNGSVTLDAGSKIVGNGMLASPDTLENVGNTITGAGTIGDGTGDLALKNDAGGTIDATGTIVLDTGQTITNAGLLEATGGGELDVKDGEINWTGTTATLGNNGIVIGAGSELLVDVGTLKLGGGGDVELSGTDSSIIGAAADSTDALISDNDIAGSGEISNVTLTNNGIIDATGTIVLDTGTAVDNTGLIEATGASGELDVKDDEIDWTGGTPTLGTNGILIAANSELLVDNGSLTLAGGGDVELSGNNSIITGNLAGNALINDDTIAGAGQITNLTLTNNGTIDATGSLTINTGHLVTNTADAILEATGANGTLTIDDQLDNFGTVNANDGVATVVLAGAVTNESTGLLEATAGSELKVTTTSIVNDGTDPSTGIAVAGAGSKLLINGVTLTLTGGGNVLLSDGGTITGNGGAGLTNSDNDISGAGTISHLTLTNDKTIDATTGTLTLNTGNTIANAGLLEATGGGVLDIQDGTVNNTGTGTDGILINGSSELLVDNGTVNLTGSGDVTLDAGSKVEGGGAGDKLVNANNTIAGAGTIGDGSGDLALTNNATIEAVGGTLTINTGNTVVNTGTLETGTDTLQIDDSQINNTGNIQVDGTLALDVATLTLNKNGTVTLAGGAIDAAAAGQTLENSGNTIEGYGQIGGDTGIGANANLTLNNDTGTIEANSTATPLVIATGNTVTNADTLEAAAGATLQIDDSTVDNTGNIQVDGTLALGATGATPSGITVTLDGAGTVTLAGGTIDAALSGETLENNGNLIEGTGQIGGDTGVDANTHLSLDNNAGTIEAKGGTLTIATGNPIVNAGTLEANNGAMLQIADNEIDNTGNIQVDGTFTLDVATGSLTLDDNGTVMLSTGVIEAAIGGETLVNNGNTIEGTGRIGAGTDLNLTLDNNAGTIDADVSGKSLTIETGHTVTNNGTLEASNGGTLVIDDTVSTDGTVLVEGGTIEIGASDPGLAISFNNGAGTDYGELILEKASGYSVGAITGFAGQDSANPSLSTTDEVELVGFKEKTFSILPGAGNSEAVTLTDAGGHTVTLTFDNPGGTLNVKTVGGNTLITDPPASDSSAAAPTAEGALSFATDTSTNAVTDSVTPEGSGYLGSLTIASVTESNGHALADWQFNLGNDQINLAPGQTLTQSYGVNLNGSNETVSISVGGPGNDTFAFEPGIGADTIVNFNVHNDAIDLENFSNIHSLQQLESLITTDSHGYAVIELGHGDSITIPGVTATYLEAHLHTLVHLI